jgi:predicted DNA-binding transcriptional regulator AlpA
MTTNTAQPDRADRVDDRLMTVREICAELGGLSRRTFYRWREIGSAPQCPKIPNGEVRAWRSDFLAWLESLHEGGDVEASAPGLRDATASRAQLPSASGPSPADSAP